MNAARDLGEVVGTARSCAVLDVPKASYYRWHDQAPSVPTARPSPPRALNPNERQEVLDTLNCEAFCDKAPAQIYATLLDTDRYLCSIRTMYRILSENRQVRERRDQLRHPSYKKPELLATGPNQVWSWDITKLLGPEKGTYFYLYVILDIYSRYVVGWLVATHESAALARQLLQETVAKEGVDPQTLVIHADRGPSMTSKSVTLLLSDLGIVKSHSRPHVSDDNPFSEAQFKTLKYRPEFPGRFGSLQHARSVCHDLFRWYNLEHHHCAIALLTPADVHHGRADQVLGARHRTLEAAYAAKPERFVRGRPQKARLPREVWINPPTVKTDLDPSPSQSSEKSTPLAAPPLRLLGSTRPKLPGQNADAVRGSNAALRPIDRDRHPENAAAELPSLGTEELVTTLKLVH